MKNILLCTPSFHGYEKILIKFLKMKGYNVDFFDFSKEKYREARKIKNPFLKLWNNIYLKNKNQNLKNKFQSKIMNEDLLRLDKKYEYIIKIGLFFLDESTLKILRSKGKYLILHHWDVICDEYKKRFEKEKKYFNKISSYSKVDSERYNVNYLPNFYFKNLESNKKNQNDVFCITSDFRRKYFLEKIAKDLKKKNIKYEIILVNKKLQSPLITIQSEALSLEETIEKYMKSKVILELVKEENYGCSTLRALDCLGLKKKLITNNKEIINEDYYNKNNILIINENNIDISIEFINSLYEELPKEIVEKYYIDN